MALIPVFNSTVDPTQPNLSSRFKDAVAFFIAAPLLSLAVISQQLNDCVTPNDIFDLVETVSDIAFVVNLALPLFGFPSIPTPSITPDFPLLPGLP